MQAMKSLHSSNWGLEVFPIIFMCMILFTVSSLSVPQPQNRKNIPKQGRNDHTVSRQKQKGYALRSSGKNITRRKPPKWETEGDLLFADNRGDRDSKLQELLTIHSSPEHLLNAYFKDSVKNDDNVRITKNEQRDEMIFQPSSSSVLWGDISVGPILAPKLKKLFEFPTPIQSAAFKVLAKKKEFTNVVIASPTGSGKTLSFLLPLIVTTERNSFCTIMIVTPTVDLAFQTQRVLNQFWDVDAFGRSALYVVSQPEKESDLDNFQSLTIAEMKMYNPPMIAGTPKSLISLISYCRDNKIDLLSNISTVVLDEADRLLQTELAARGSTQTALVNSPTNHLIDMMKRTGISFDVTAKIKLRLVCVSATVGRTLRRQVMELTGAPSIDKAASLVTADDRTGKNEEKRKNSILPRTIHHKYICSSTDSSDDYASVDIILNTLRTLPPAPVLIFPGNVGVIKMADLLHERGCLDDVFTLRDNYHTNHSNVRRGESWNDTPIFVIGEKFSRGLDIPGIQYVFLATPPAKSVTYTHLAGRTGRAGAFGTVFTVLKDMEDAKRLIVLSNSLGIKFSPTDISPIEINSNGGKDGDMNVQCDDLSSLGIIALKGLLRQRGLNVTGKKSDLIERLMNGG